MATAHLGNYALQHTLKYGHLDAAEVLLAGKARIEAVQGKYGYHCTGCGYSKMAEKLFDCGAEIDHASKNGATALHNTARNEHKNMVNTLLGRGARTDLAST